MTTSSTGAVTASRQYGAFGTLQTGLGGSGFAFAGREWDSEAGLYFNRARYLDPKLGRFLSADPIGFEAGVNFYSYVTGNPVNFTDPDGLVKFKNVPPDKRADIEAALALLRQELTESCCAGDKANKLLKKVNDPNLEIEYKPSMKLCGRTPFRPMLGLKNKLQVSPNAWNCCLDQSLSGIPSLASTMLHEMRHQGQIIPTEKGPRGLEASCFGCRIE